MTKTETERTARNAADLNATANEFTVEQLEAMDWTTRQAKAAELFALVGGDHGRYAGAYNETYRDRILSNWAGKCKQREAARRNFRHVAASMTLKQATEKVAALANGVNFRGARVDGQGMEILRGDRDGGRVYWTWKRTDRVVTNPEDDRQRVYFYELEVQISTSGTSYSPARMALVHKIHGELLEVAAELEATFDRIEVITTCGIPEIAEPGEAQVPGIDLTTA